MTKTLTEQYSYSPTRDDVLDALGAVSETEYNKLWHSLDEKTREINELVQKMHILEKQLAIATKALKQYANRRNWVIGNFMCANNGVSFSDAERAEQALKEIEEYSNSLEIDGIKKEVK